MNGGPGPAIRSLSLSMLQESSSKTLKLAHLYALDHIIQTIYTLKFARHYWYENPHDGERIINSQAQRDLIDLAISRGEVSRDRPEDIAEIAYGLWQREKGFAAFVLFLAWCVKVSRSSLNPSLPGTLMHSLCRSTSYLFCIRTPPISARRPTTPSPSHPPTPNPASTLRPMSGHQPLLANPLIRIIKDPSTTG